MLQHIRPKPLIEPQNLWTEADYCVAAGRRVFEESGSPQLRTYDPELIAKVRSRFCEERNASALPDGTMGLLRWVRTTNGIALSP